MVPRSFAIPFRLLVAFSFASSSLRADDTRLVSTADGSTPLGGYACDLSADGRFVLFGSESSELVADDTNLSYDLFVRDLETGVVERVNVADDESEDPSGNPLHRGSISADGRFVAFTTSSTLDPADLSDVDVYLRDRSAGTTTLVSRTPARVGVPNSMSPGISADGSWVVFVSTASNLVDDDTNHVRDVFEWERATGTIVRVSLDSAGSQLDVPSDGEVQVSADGRLVAFQIAAAHVGHGPNVFVKDLASGALEQMDGFETGGGFADASHLAGMSSDGRFVLFATDDGLVAADGNGTRDGYVRDRSLGTVERVTLGNGFRELSNVVAVQGMSEDGRRIAFSTTVDASREDSDGLIDGYVFLRDTGVALRTTIGREDQESLSPAFAVGLAADGRSALFVTSACGFWSSEDNLHFDLFERRLADVPAAWTNYGTGLDGRFGTPSLTLDALPRRTTTIGLHIGNSSGLYGSGVLFLGFASASLPTSLGGTLLVAPSEAFVVPLSPWDNALVATIPGSGDLPGLHLYLQVLEIDPWAVKGVSFTPGLDLTIGD